MYRRKNPLFSNTEEQLLVRSRAPKENHQLVNKITAYGIRLSAYSKPHIAHGQNKTVDNTISLTSLQSILFKDRETF